MAALEALLAVLGVVFLVLIVRVAIFGRHAETAAPDDLVAPYRAGLHATVRMQKVAADLEQQIYAEAARHLDVPASEDS